MTLAFRARLMRNGWMIPHSMEWMFWPAGFKLPDDHVGGPNELIQKSLHGRFKVTNHAAFMAVLQKLGVVREAK